MVTSKPWILALALVSAAAGAREAASPNACQAAAAQPPIATAKTAFDRDPSDLKTGFALADAWSDAGCFNDALRVLQTVVAVHPGRNKELETRLRVARSLVGEEHFFDNIDRADAEAKLKREIFRCTTLSDADACGEALLLRPDDPLLLIAQGDALLHAKRPAEAINRYRLASVLAPNQHDVAAKIAAAQAVLPAVQAGGASASHDSAGGPAARVAAARAGKIHIASAAPLVRHYSNAAPESRSH